MLPIYSVVILQPTGIEQPTQSFPETLFLCHWCVYPLICPPEAQYFTMLKINLFFFPLKITFQTASSVPASSRQPVSPTGSFQICTLVSISRVYFKCHDYSSSFHHSYSNCQGTHRGYYFCKGQENLETSVGKPRLLILCCSPSPETDQTPETCEMLVHA